MPKPYQPSYVPTSERELRDKERGNRVKQAWSKPALKPCPLKFTTPPPDGYQAN